MDDQRLTRELRTDQERREAQEHELERSIDDEREAAQHARRADKAKYLRKKLEEREASERDASERKFGLVRPSCGTARGRSNAAGPADATSG